MAKRRTPSDKAIARASAAIRKIESLPSGLLNPGSLPAETPPVRTMVMQSDWAAETSGEYAATATPVRFDPTTSTYKLSTESTAPYAVWAPVSARNPSTLVPTAKPPGEEDSIGWFVFRGRWELEYMLPLAERIRCQVNKSGGVDPTDASFAADAVTLVGPRGSVLPSTTPALVYNVPKWRMPDDHVLEAVYNSTSGHWEACWRAPLLTKVYAYVNESGGVLGTDSDFEVDGIAAIDEPGATVPTSLTLGNTFGFTLDDNAVVMGIYNHTLDLWVCIQSECPA